MTEDDKFARQASRVLRAAQAPQDAIPAMRALTKQHLGNPAAVRFCRNYERDVPDGSGEWSKMHYGRGIFPGANIRVLLIDGEYAIPVPGESGWSE